MLARSLTLNVSGRFAIQALGFIASVLLARLLGAAGRGLLGVMLSVSTIALALTAIGQPLAVTYYASRKHADHRAILGNTLIHALLLAVVLIPATVLLRNQIAAWFGHGKGGDTWILAAALVPITFLNWTAGNQLLGMLRFGLSNFFGLIAQVAYVVLVVVMLGPLKLGVGGALVAAAVGAMLLVLLCVPVILRGKPPRLDKSLAGRMLHYGSRVQVGVIFQMVNYRFDVIIMQFYRPLRQVGYYVVAQTIAELVITLATAFQSSILPLVSHFEGDQRQNELTVTALRHHAILAGGAVVTNSVFGSLVILYAYGPQFRPAVVPMLVLLPGIWFLGMGIVAGSDLGGRGRPGLSSALAGMAAVVTAVLDFTLIPPLGVMGGALASVAAYTTFGVASMIALGRVSGIPVRELVVPTRRELAAYPHAAASLLHRLGAGGRS